MSRGLDYRKQHQVLILLIGVLVSVACLAGSMSLLAAQFDAGERQSIQLAGSSQTVIECNQRAYKVVVYYDTTQVMTVDKSAIVDLFVIPADRLTPNDDRPDMGDATVETRLACGVEATAEGADFAVAPEEWDRRSFLDENADVLRWTWTVKPLKAGRGQPLVLRLRALIDDTGTSAVLPVGPDPMVMVIDVLGPSVSMTDRVGGWIKWLAGILLALAGMTGLTLVLIRLLPKKLKSTGPVRHIERALSGQSERT